jgi:uncharacterized membrane protein
VNLRRHARFYAALAVGVAAFLLGRRLGSWELRFVVAGDAFFLAYLVLTGVFLARATVEHLRAIAADADEGLPLILLATTAAVVVSLAAIYLLLSRPGALATPAGWLGLAGIPLGWLTLNTLAGFHYANLYYAPRGDRHAGGLAFPGGADRPGPWDFLYFAFVIGMTAQVSDVEVTSTRLRRTVLLHGIGSFFYYTVILALAVNAAVNLAGG